jgi:hypothetical protein
MAYQRRIHSNIVKTQTVPWQPLHESWSCGLPNPLWDGKFQKLKFTTNLLGGMVLILVILTIWKLDSAVNQYMRSLPVSLF